MQKAFIVLGLIFLAIGVVWPWLSSTSFGRLPGDIFVQRDNFKFYFPITSMILVSIVLTFIVWIFRQ